MVTFASVDAAVDSRATTEHSRAAMDQRVIERVISEDFNQWVTSKIQEAFAAEQFRSALELRITPQFEKFRA